MVRPEIELLLGCARATPEPEAQDRIRAALRREIDWSYLLRMAERHRLKPLLYWHLRTTGAGAVPGPILDGLLAHFERNKGKNLFLTAQLSRILQLLEAHGIPAVCYKGPALAMSAYGNLALREFDDLDLLVDRQNVLCAKRLLVSEGYRPQAALTEAQERSLLASQHPFGLIRDRGGVIVELHWAISPRYASLAVEPGQLWERLEAISVAGVRVLALAPEVLLPSLCEHGAKHGWERLSWICDIAQMIRTATGLDWDRLVRQAGASRSTRRLALGLCLARDLLGVALPDAPRRQVESDPVLSRLARQVRERLFQEPPGHAGLLAGALFQLRALERWGDRVRFCRLALTTPTIADWRRVRLSPGLTFLYYPLRAMRLLRGRHHAH